MLNTYLKRPLTLERYRSSPAGPHLDAFSLWLKQRGYQSRRILRLIRGVHRFSQWAHDHGLSIEALDAKALARFRDHLQGQQALRYPSGSYRPLFLGARHFVTFLEADGVHTTEEGTRGPGTLSFWTKPASPLWLVGSDDGSVARSCSYP
jgi:hypothetical protein